MKIDLIDVNDTQKNLIVEIPSAVVDAEIDKVARDYSKAARIPGFRPGKVPAKVVRQRFRDQILHDVAHGLIPRAVDDALRERGVEPVDTPDIKNVVVEEGQPLKFTAAFETVPPIEPGDYASLSVTRTQPHVEEGAVEQALAELRERAARYEPIEDRGVDVGDSVLMDLVRTARKKTEAPLIVIPGQPPAPADTESDKHDGVTVEIGAQANPPGFDEALLGLRAGDRKAFTVTYPEDYTVAELAGTDVQYEVDVKAVRTRVVPEMDDELAKDLGDFESLAALRTRVRADLEHEAGHAADREVRAELLKQLAARVEFEPPAALVDREIDRRVEEFVRRLMEQQIDPMQTNINWEEFRERQKEAAADAVKSALVLDEVARREQIAATTDELEAEVSHYAERTGRTPAAVRARLEKEGGLSRLATGLRREKTVTFLLGKTSAMRQS